MNNEEKQNIVKFIQDVNQKNYAEAHKYLKGAIEDKIARKIDRATDKPLF